jgi:hypothetical protein
MRISEAELRIGSTIRRLGNTGCNGFLFQLPGPTHTPSRRIIGSVNGQVRFRILLGFIIYELEVPSRRRGACLPPEEILRRLWWRKFARPSHVRAVLFLRSISKYNGSMVINEQDPILL